uniref:Uncharacterized protein n=1 Tax=Arundo donax TaxID=35708 RepID=A0A0A9AJA2_ARUDO
MNKYANFACHFSLAINIRIVVDWAWKTVHAVYFFRIRRLAIT